jgi:hypothetical protein
MNFEKQILPYKQNLCKHLFRNKLDITQWLRGVLKILKLEPTDSGLQLSKQILPYKQNLCKLIFFFLIIFF